MNASNRKDRNGPPLSVTTVTTGWTLPCWSTWARSRSGRPPSSAASARASSTALTRVVLVRGRGEVEPVLVLRPVVPAAGDPPGPTTGGLELGSCPAARRRYRAGRLRRERRPAAGGQLAAFALVVRLQDQVLLAQQPQDRGLGHGVPVVADHRPDPAVTPRRVTQRVAAGGVTDPGPDRSRPGSLDRVPGPGAGLMATPGPLGHADQLAEPRGRHARGQTDYLKVLEGPSRPSADFFQTLSSTAASPNAWVRSATSASSWASRVVGPALPATSPARPASRNCRFQFPTDCSETFDRRAASATDTSPAKIDSTTRTFSSTGNTGALDMVPRLLQQVTTRKQRALPQSLTRDTTTQATTPEDDRHHQDRTMDNQPEIGT